MLPLVIMHQEKSDEGGCGLQRECYVDPNI